ncbi:MAG: alpha-L-arabinofuranosidase [Clostridia bacterium]|nr:alpha-L-arabinofuranosidase [Clostridia bacterium]
MRIKLYPEQKGKPLGNLFGLFFEDLNHAADGGLYAELIQNRDFEFDPVDRPDYHALTGWKTVGEAAAEVSKSDDAPFPNNPHIAVIRAKAGAGIANTGWGSGMFAEAGKRYRLVLWAKADEDLRLRAELCGSAAPFPVGPAWSRFEAVLTPEETADSAALQILAPDGGTFRLAYVSLMPLDTYRGEENGLRRDLAEALAEMKPKFLRFPGGCLTHDGMLDPDARDGIYNWKRTVGPVENRPARRNNWHYHQTMGLGFFEYFRFCEDMGCEPLPVVNAGMDTHHLRFADGELFEQYVRDAVDLIDFAKGGPETEWGKVRCEMGHPAPFCLRYLAVGNEEIYERFHRNMARFAEAIRKKDPTVELIGTAGPVCGGKPYDMGWAYAREQKLDYVDEHYYQSPEWFLAHADHYRDYPADGPKVFLGEYASWGNRMLSALAEAAYMTGLQNAPAVALACYAPMLCRAEYVNWQPDMLWFDSRRILKTANYHVQSMFMRHQGDFSIPFEADGNDPLPEEALDMGGKITVFADETDVSLTDIVLTTPDRETKLPDAVLGGRGTLAIGDTAGDFTLSLTMRRTGGHRGIAIRFGEGEDGAFFDWTIGGWQNSDSGIGHRRKYGGSCLTQSNFSVEDGRDTRLTLSVQGRKIVTRIDGEILNETEIKPIRLKPLYLAASVEAETGDVILKAVNVRETPVSAVIPLACSRCTAEHLCAAPDAENTFDDPDAVKPVVFEVPAGETVDMTFPGYSVTVLRFKP